MVIFRQILRVRLKYILIAVIVCGTMSLFKIQKFTYTPRNTENYPILIWWTPFIFENKKLISCEDRYTCVVTKNRSLEFDVAAYLFYGSNFKEDDLPLPKKNIPWAIFHEESPKNLPFFLYEEGQHLFNITSTFSRDSSLPLVLQYLEDLQLITDTTYYVNLKQKNKLLKQISPVLYIQSDCETPIERDLYVSELMKYIAVDSYGSCLNNKRLPEQHSVNKILTNLYDEDFMKFVAQYKFTIAIENSICNDYVTEKLWRPLIAGSIPIYWGSPTVTVIYNYGDLS
uniref:Fucosyltransferase n=1 Tax=Photinus pyralis TaxID=7054 RepID=A0A1Y1L3Q5_PHOPY